MFIMGIIRVSDTKEFVLDKERSVPGWSGWPKTLSFLTTHQLQRIVERQQRNP